MNKTQEAVEFFKKMQETTPIELTQADMREIRVALTDIMLKVWEKDYLNYEEKKMLMNHYQEIRDKFVATN